MVVYILVILVYGIWDQNTLITCTSHILCLYKYSFIVECYIHNIQNM